MLQPNSPMKSETSDDYVRITRIRDASSPARDELTKPANDPACESRQFGRQIGTGYSVDRWFLEDPVVGRGMVLLRFRRNGILRLGLFTSSPITFISGNEIRTLNSVYFVEQRSLEEFASQ
jgi:hypothetical protein